MIQQISENIYVDTGFPLCNVGIITTKEGVVIIDTPLRPSDAVQWRDTAMAKGEVRYLVNTEEHPDHWQGSWFCPGTLITHQVVRDVLEKQNLDEVIVRMKAEDPRGLSLMEGYRPRLADITFTENLDIYLGVHTIRLFSLPGHSLGGIGVYIPEEGVVFTADIVFYQRKSWLQDAKPQQWLESLKKLSKLDVDVIIPGHGEICKKDYLDEQADIVRRWIDVVQSAIKQGLTQEEAASRILCPDHYPMQSMAPMTALKLNRLIIARLYKLYGNRV